MINAAALVLACAMWCPSATAQPGGPIFTVQYGDSQNFGYLGIPQRWVNILGNVSDPDGVASLSFRLNGGPLEPLSIGPDSRRLSSPGDFNVEIDRSRMLIGPNQILIIARDALNNTSTKTVTVNYTNASVWPTSYNVNWTPSTPISDVAYIVDGLWTVEPDGLRTVEVGYDRVVAIGDTIWQNYEVTVPITAHGIDPLGYQWPNVSPGCGLILRWRGHTDWGGSQPVIGYIPVGATLWYDWGQDGPLALDGSPGLYEVDVTGCRLQLNTRYIHKFRVETIPGQGVRYRAKVWADGQGEPGNWDLDGMQDPGGLTSGSMLFVAHYVDATFGNVSIIPLGETTPLVISSINVQAGASTATVSWTTDKPATGSVSYGLTTSYGLGTVPQPQPGMQHSIVLTGLSPGTVYHYRITAVDAAGNPATTPDATFISGAAAVPSTIVSDDFNDHNLESVPWTFVNPLGDATLTLTGFGARIAVPSGSEHDIGLNRKTAPRLMQPANNTDFEIEVKFDITLTQVYQSYGVLVEGDQGRFIRFEFYRGPSGVQVSAARFTDIDSDIVTHASIAGGASLYMQVRRRGDIWTQFYSYDGLDWFNSGNFSHPMAVNAVGVYVGNSSDGGNPAPAHAGLFDYFFNTSSPIIPEDADICPSDPAKTEPGICGCGVPDDDGD